MLRLIRQRLVEAGRAFWQTEKALKSIRVRPVEFSPEELEWVLNPEERREWDRLTKGTSTLRGLYQKKSDGEKLTPEEEEQFNILRGLASQRAIMRRDLLKRLVLSPKAPPAKVEHWRSLLINERIRDSATAAAAKVRSNRGPGGNEAKRARRKEKQNEDMMRMRQLEALGEQATEDERQELAALRASKGPGPFKQKLKSIKVKVDNGLPLTPEEQKVWDNYVASRARFSEARREDRKLMKSLEIKVDNRLPLTLEEQEVWDRVTRARVLAEEAGRERQRKKAESKDADDGPSVDELG